MTVKAKIFSHKELIGTAVLKVGDISMGGVFGNFTPTDVYFDKIQKEVWEFWRTNTPDYKKWGALRFNVKLENGVFLFPRGGYTIDDMEELPNEPLRIDICGVPYDIIQDFLLESPPRIFTEEPWKKLHINQKIAFEDELMKELGIKNQPFFDFMRRTEKHILFDSKFSALCHDQRNDDVLFEIHKPNFDKLFAVVHLTWTGKREKGTYPITTFYSDFDDFKYTRMYADKADWEDY